MHILIYIYIYSFIYICVQICKYICVCVCDIYIYNVYVCKDIFPLMVGVLLSSVP